MTTYTANSDGIQLHRRHPSFSLRTLFALFAILALGLFALTRFVGPAVSRQWAIRSVFNSGGVLEFDGQWDEVIQPPDQPADAVWHKLSSIHAPDDRAAAEAARRVRYIREVRRLTLGAGVTDDGLSAISRVSQHASLQSLSLFDSPVTRAGISQLANVEWLRDLYLYRSAINDEVVTDLGSIPSLRNLWLLDIPDDFGVTGSTSSNRMTERAFSAVGELRHLQFVSLKNLNISDASAGHLHPLRNLRFLGLQNCQISDEAVTDLRAALPDCEIDVSSWSTDEPFINETE